MPLSKGTEVGRYVLLECVGRGGMGEVYAAYDPELDRRVALKVLSPRLRDTQEDRDGGGARLVREAQAMAKLSHPGVVQVYDAGSVDGNVFIAMEFIDGRTFKAWLRQDKRPLFSIVGVLTLAGEGLAAAHREGLVHRDFKPQNVMVRDDGVVRVLDFGLARRVDGRNTMDEAPGPHMPDRSVEDVDPGISRDSLSQVLTQTGLVHGTPAYMAPEQFCGGSVDARSDQFAFCIVAYEALYGERPFPSGSYRDLAKAVQSGRIADPPRGANVPPRVRRVLLQGLSVDPDSRFASMTALLRALRDAVVPPWRRPAVLGMGAGVLLVAGVSATSNGADESEPCSSVRDKLDEVWNDARKSEIADRFAAQQLGYADATWARAETMLDKWADQWAATRTEACEATQVSREQSAELMDRRMACLDRHLAELSTLTELLANADATVVEKAVAGAAALSSAQECSPKALLAGPMAVDLDQETRDKLAKLDARRASAAILARAGRAMEGRQRLEALLAEAEQLDHGPLLAELHFDLAVVHYVVGDPVGSEAMLHRALELSIAHDHEVVELSTLTVLAGVVGAMLAQPDRGRIYGRMAEALHERVDYRVSQTGSLDTFLGMIEMQAGNHEEALDRFRRAVDERGQVFGEMSMEVVPLRVNIATELAALGRNDEAIELYQHTIEVTDQAYGTGHPVTGVTRTNLGAMYARQGNLGAAVEVLTDAIDVLDAAAAGSGLNIAQAFHNRATMYVLQGRNDEAQVDLERAIELKTAAVGPDHPSTALSRANLADVDLRRGDFEKALASVDAAIPLLEKGYGNTPTYAVVHVSRAEALFGLGRLEEAKTAAERGLELLGERGEPNQQAEARFMLARVEHAVASDEAARAAAKSRARDAAERMSELGPQFERKHSEIQRWLRAH